MKENQSSVSTPEAALSCAQRLFLWNKLCLTPSCLLPSLPSFLPFLYLLSFSFFLYLSFLISFFAFLPSLFPSFFASPPLPFLVSSLSLPLPHPLSHSDLPIKKKVEAQPVDFSCSCVLNSPSLCSPLSDYITSELGELPWQQFPSLFLEKESLLP